MPKTYPRAYLLTKVLTASKREVVLYLYEGAIEYLMRAVEARKEDEVAEAGEAIDRVIAILIELSCSLDYNQNGSLAIRLDGIYNYMIEALTLSNKDNELEPLETCHSMLKILCDAWQQAINSEKPVDELGSDSQLAISA